MAREQERRWVPLEARKAPWAHRPPVDQRVPWHPQEEREVLDKKRSAHARTCFSTAREENHLTRDGDAIAMVPVANMQIPAQLPQQSLAEMSQILRSRLTEESRVPQMAWVKRSAESQPELHIVCENSYDRNAETVEIIPAEHPSKAPERILFKKCCKWERRA
mmetsp:Transcript_55118/g.96554  ORF Transcript_55118/g.96554 Transcript_55118/m.96554 type:complete len:163 (-) Transcript_55118:14-502(-)